MHDERKDKVYGFGVEIRRATIVRILCPVFNSPSVICPLIITHKQSPLYSSDNIMNLARHDIFISLLD